MACEFCTDEEGHSAFPHYGVGPHICFHKIPGAVIGESVLLPKEQWPDNYIEDSTAPGLGFYWCPECGEGKEECLKWGTGSSEKEAK